MKSFTLRKDNIKIDFLFRRLKPTATQEKLLFEPFLSSR